MLMTKKAHLLRFSDRKNLTWYVSYGRSQHPLTCHLQSLSKSQTLFATFNLCQSVVPPPICLPQIAIPPIFFCTHPSFQNIHPNWHPWTVVYCSRVQVWGRGYKLRRANSPSFAAQSPSKFHPWPISLSQWQSHAIALPQFSFTNVADSCKTENM